MKTNKENNIPEKVDFDNFADSYNQRLEEGVRFFGEESSYFAEYKIRIVSQTLKYRPKNILEYGCGIGRNIRFLRKYFPESKISGCDISLKSLEIASIKNTDSDFFIISPEEINGREEHFDMIFISCVFHHIEPDKREKSMSFINRLLKKDGLIYFFEHNPYNPVTQHIVNTCPWDTDAILLKPRESLSLFKIGGFSILAKKYTLFFPAFLGFLRFLEKLIWFLPLGGQYYIKAKKN